jgi:hypothetical protein
MVMCARGDDDVACSRRRARAQFPFFSRCRKAPSPRTFFAIRRGADDTTARTMGNEHPAITAAGLNEMNELLAQLPANLWPGSEKFKVVQVRSRDVVVVFFKISPHALINEMHSLVSDAPRRVHRARNPHLTRRACSTGTTR